MKTEYNSKAFTPDEVKSGLMNDLLAYLLGHNAKSEKSYYEVHIWSDGYCQIVDWVDSPYEKDYSNGGFEFVYVDEVVAKELVLPDNSIVLVRSDEEGKEILDGFLEDHPNYEMNDWGRWVDKTEYVPVKD